MKFSFPLLALAAFLGSGETLLADTSPPAITSFSVSSPTVDVTTGDATVQVTLQVTDDDSGFNYSNLYLYNPDGKFVTNFFFRASDVQSGGTNRNGTYVVDIAVPRYGKPGNWRLDGFLLDNASNRSNYGGTGTPFPGPGTDTISVTNTGAVDNTPAVLASISLSPATVDVSAQNQTVAVTLHITDGQSGLRYGSAILLKPDGSESGISHFFQGNAGVGSPQDSTFTFNLEIPRGSEPGLWKIGNQLRDRVGNLTLAYNDPNAQLTVINTTGPSTGALSDACDATQFAWNTYGDDDWFFQTETSNDGVDAAQTGPVADNSQTSMQVEVTGPGTLSFRWKVESASGDVLTVNAAGPGNTHGISGTTQWLPITLTIGPGPQTVTWTYAKNASGSSGKDAGWVDQVYFAAEQDSEPPTLQYINIAPDPVSVAAGDQNVIITFEVSDDFSGVYGGQISILDENGNGYDSSFDSADRVSGDDRFGTYRVTFPVLQNDLEPFGNLSLGDWHVEMRLEDWDSNIREYSSGTDFPRLGDERFTVTDSATDALGIQSIDPFTPDPVDVTMSSQTTTLGFTMNDPSSNFSYGYVYIFDSQGNLVASFYFDPSFATGNHYSVPLTIPRYGRPGDWHVTFGLYDESNEYTQITGSIQAPGDDKITVINSGAVDSAPPVVSAISITPSTVDTTTAAKAVDFTVSISDNLSGIQYAYLAFINPAGTTVSSLFSYVDGSTITGNSFTVTRTLPQGSMQGVWRCEVYARDGTGNFVRYGEGASTTPFTVPENARFHVGPVTVSSYTAFTGNFSLVGNHALLAANPDSDWATNALEFLLGLDPTIPTPPDPTLYKVIRIGNELQLDFKPAANLTVTDNNGDFLNFANAGGNLPLRVTGQTANALAGPWTNTRPLPVGGGVYRVVLPVGSDARGFCRLMFLDP